ERHRAAAARGRTVRLPRPGPRRAHGGAAHAHRATAPGHHRHTGPAGAGAPGRRADRGAGEVMPPSTVTPLLYTPLVRQQSPSTVPAGGHACTPPKTT